MKETLIVKMNLKEKEYFIMISKMNNLKDSLKMD